MTVKMDPNLLKALVGKMGGVEGPQGVGSVDPAANARVAGPADGFSLGGTTSMQAEPPMPAGDPLSGVGDKLLELLNGGAFNADAAPADTAKAVEQLQQLAGQMSPQQQLELMKQLGLEPGSSMTDKKTVDAIKNLQEHAGLFPSGQMDLETLLALVEAANNKRNAAAAGSRPTTSSGQRASSGMPGAGGSNGATEGAGQYVPRRTGGGGGAQEAAGPIPSSTPGTAPTGTLKANQKEAYDAAIKEGLSPTAAKALVANMTGESLAKPNDNHWDVHHMSQGIVQWDPQRSAAIKKQFGKEPKDMTVAEQTKAAIWEMKNNPAYRETWNALQGNDPNAMVSALVRNYERPANPSGEISKRMGHYNQLGHLNA